MNESTPQSGGTDRHVHTRDVNDAPLPEAGPGASIPTGQSASSHTTPVGDGPPYGAADVGSGSWLDDSDPGPDTGNQQGDGDRPPHSGGAGENNRVAGG
ncbi:hypothetical protein [Phenylobacterium deserti]|uniref:Uncharacterized protein n=1 Tax=Phenylobacterium deserti TaxID=1914756 RepID=A0A328AR79_9CAUL|nr:hypothetical protein [Phenylobacterium deserti]RAK56795.1 hypothetical protein DJ018_02130 [Phenylobacterium deserti]